MKDQAAFTVVLAVALQAHHQQLTERMNKLLRRMEAIENEMDPAALKSKLAEQSALLKETHDRMMRLGDFIRETSGIMMKIALGKEGKSENHPTRK